MKFQNFLFALVSLLLAIVAGAFVYNIGLTVYELAPDRALIVGAFAFVLVACSGYISDLIPGTALFMALNAKNISRKANQKNIGGLAQDHYYAFADDIDTYPTGLNPDFDAATTFTDLVNLEATDLFVMKPNKYFYKFPCTLEEGQIKSTMTGPIGSKAFENTASFSNPANLDEMTGHIAFIANKPVIILARELNGTLKVIGTQEYPAQLDTYELTNGAKVSDGNMQKHSFKSYGCIPSPNYTGAIPVEPPPVAP